MTHSRLDDDQLTGPVSAQIADEVLETTAVLLTSVGGLYRLARSADGRWWMTVDEPERPGTRMVWREVRAPEPWPPIVGCPVRLIAANSTPEAPTGRSLEARCWTAPVEAIRRNGKPSA